MPSCGRAPSELVEVVVETLRTDGDLAEQTLDRLAVLMQQFARFAERGLGVARIEDVVSAVVQAFVESLTTEGAPPGPSLQHFRRLAVRVLFRTGRRLGLADGDPSIDVALPARALAAFRPLEDPEVELCRCVALGTSTRAAAAWALGEATARTGEFGGIRRCDVDLGANRVWLRGTARVRPRWGQLTDWGSPQLMRRLEGVDPGSESPVLGGGAPGSALAQSSAVGVISQTLVRVGLRGAPGVRPSSVAAWAGRKIFEATDRIDEAALALGLASLDRTARFIGWEWAARGG
jgi:integrase/recombinase XerC